MKKISKLITNQLTKQAVLKAQSNNFIKFQVVVPMKAQLYVLVEDKETLSVVFAGEHSKIMEDLNFQIKKLYNYLKKELSYDNTVEMSIRGFQIIIKSKYVKDLLNSIKDSLLQYK